jgi:uncharacterized membrane protein YbhN (UPF0104 family)
LCAGRGAQPEATVAADARARWGSLGRWAVGLAVALVCAWLLVRDLDWRAVAAALGAADYAWVAVGVSAAGVAFFTRTRRWQALLWRARVRFRPALTALLVGQVVNLVLPVRSGDVVRAVWIGAEPGIGASQALGSVAVEKAWDLLALLACGLALLIWVPLPEWFARSTWGTAVVLTVGGVVLWAGLRWRAVLFRWAGRLLARLPAGWDGAILPRLQRLADGLDAVRRPDVSARALAWTGATWGLGLVVNLAVLAAFGVRSFVAALFLLAALMVGAAVPVPGRLGLFEGICVVSLALFDVPRDQALAAGLVLHLVVMGPPLVAAALLALWRGRRDGAGRDVPA